MSTDRHLRRAQDLIDFHTEHGRIPSIVSQDATERSLAQWRLRQLRTAQPNTVSELLDEQLPGWSTHRRRGRPALIQHTPTYTERDVQRVTELIDFHLEHGRAPSLSDPDQRELASWSQRMIEQGFTAITDTLDELLPTWRKNSSPSIEPADMAQRIVKFHSEHGRLPVVGVDGETRMAHWIHLRRHLPVKTQAHCILDESIPGWEHSHLWPRVADVHHLQRADELIHFVRCRGRMPLQGAEDEAERSLAWWRINQLRYLNSFAVAKLDEHLPCWRSGALAESNTITA